MHYLSVQEAFLDPLPLFVSCAYNTYFHVLVALIFMCSWHLFSWADEGSRLILRAGEVVSCVTETERYPDLGFPSCQTFTSHSPQKAQRAEQHIKMSKTMLGTRLRLRVGVISAHQVSHRQPARISPDNRFRLIGILLIMRLR